MSKILSKVLKNLVLPASLLVVSRVLGLYLATKIYGLQAILDTHAEGWFSIRVLFLDHDSIILANSFSNIVILIVFTLIGGYFALKYWLSVNLKYDPRTLVKLNNLNLLSWASERNNTFVRVFIWLIFMWIITILIINDMLQLQTYDWIGIIAFVISVILTWTILRCFEKELDCLNNNNSKCNLY